MSSTCITFNILCSYSISLTSPTWIFTFVFISVLQRSLAIQTGRVMVHSYTGGPRDMALSTRQSVVARSQPPPMMNWKHGKKQFLSLPFPGTHQTTFTMGMKLPCFTSCCLIGPTALMVTSLQVLQNVKTD